MGARIRRRLVLMGLLAGLGAAGRALAEDVPVPIALQAALMTKVVAYDANLPSRAAGKVRVRILTIKDDVASRAVAADLTTALSAMPTIAGLPHEESTAEYGDPQALASACASEHISIVYVTPGLSPEQVGALAKALDGVSVMTVAADPRLVPQRVVLGFDLEGGKPKLLLHLPQARRQHVELSANVLELMKVIK